MSCQARERVVNLAPNRIREVAELGFHMPDVIPLWFGESDRPTPDFIKQAAVQALADNRVFYTPNSGVPALRDAVCDYHAGVYGWEVTRDRVTVTASGMQGIMLTMQALVEPGDEVVIVSPEWPNAAGATEVMGGRAVEVPLTLANGTWSLEVERVAAACNARTRAICVNSPNNPTGWVIDEDTARELLALCRRRGIWLICDDVYNRIVYGRDHAPLIAAMAEPDDRVVSINSFSKAWNMTGWRLGWIVAPAALEKTFQVLTEFNISGPTAFVQYAGIAALRDGEDFIADNRADLQRCREMVLERLAAMPGLAATRPQGAFYAFFRVPGLTDSLAFAKRLLTEAGVGLAPGSAFGACGEGFLRLCYATRPETVAKALDRLEGFFSRKAT